MSFLTGQDRTPKFAGQVLPDRTESGLIFDLIFFSIFKVLKVRRPGRKRSGFSPVQQDLSGKFWCLVLSGQETHMPSPVEP